MTRGLVRRAQKQTVTKHSHASSLDPRGDFTDHTAAEAWQQETQCLARLAITDPAHWHTPELIKSDPETLEITTMWRGWNLNEIKNQNIGVVFRNPQRDCANIANILEQSRIMLLDLDRENLVWDPVSHTLVLVDYASTVLTDLPMTHSQQQWYTQRQHEGGYDWIKSTMESWFT